MAKAKPERDEEREDRIQDEVIVDCHDEYERVSGWWNYLAEEIQFPFTATCTDKRRTSPLKVGDKVEVLDMAGEEDCEREMYVNVRWKEDALAVPLAQLQPVAATDEGTARAVGDWHYWVRMGYEF